MLTFTFVAIVLGVGSAIGYNYFKNDYNPKVKQKIYYCSSSFEDYKSEYYSLNDDTTSENNNNTNCQMKIDINCENCEIIGNNYGFDYNKTKLIVLYSPNYKTATIYNTLDMSIYDTVTNVYFKDGVLHRKPFQIGLFNDNKIFGFIFPTGKDQNEVLYRLDKKSKIVDDHNPEYYVYSFQTYYDVGYNKYEDDPINVAEGYHFITNIQNGVIPVRTSSGLSLYNVIDEKYLLDFQNGEFYNTSNDGFIFYHDGSFYDNNTNKNELKYYDNYGNYVFSDKNNSFGYNAIELLYIIDDNTILVIGYSTTNNSIPEGMKLIDKKGNVIMNVPLSKTDISNDIKSKLTSNENYSKLTFPVSIYEYFINANYVDVDKSRISLAFNYRDKYYQLFSNVTYEIDLNKKEITNKTTF